MKALTSAATTASFTAQTQKFASKKITTKFSGYAKHGRVIDVKANMYLTTASMSGAYELRKVSQGDICNMVKFVLSNHFGVKLSAIKCTLPKDYENGSVIQSVVNEQSIKFYITREIENAKIVKDIFELSISELNGKYCELNITPKIRKFIGYVGEKVQESLSNDVYIDFDVVQRQPFIIRIK